MGHFERKFQTEGASPANYRWCQNSRVIAFSFGIIISTVHHLVLSQCTRVTDRQTARTDGQNYDSKDRASIAARAVKIVSLWPRFDVILVLVLCYEKITFY